jgi:sarcosine oxidase subunit beta
MQETFDAVVVGAGLNGAATAYFLVQAGLRRVAILEAGQACAGASGAAVGLLRTHYDNRPETELAVRSMPFFRNWPELIGDDCGWTPMGFFRFVEKHELANMHANVAVQRELGEHVDILEPADVERMAPEFRVDDIGACIHEPNCGTASNSRATFSMLKQACAKGATLRPYTRAAHIDVAKDRVTGVMTDRGGISSPVVVLAAGAWSKPLAATCGLDLPLVAREIRVAEILPPEGLRLTGSYMDPISDSWISPRRQGRALISAPNPRAGQPVDPDADGDDFTREVAASGLIPVEKRVPGIKASTVVRWWTRQDCFAPDGKPIIGAVDEIAGLYLNTASAGKGHKVAPAAGLALAELIAEGKASAADLAPFGLDRFKKDRQPWSSSEYGKRVIG